MTRDLSQKRAMPGPVLIGLLTALTAIAACLALAPVALAAPAGPAWSITSVAEPTNFTPGDVTGNENYLVTITNIGAGASDGSPITVTDALPAGLSLDAAGAAGVDMASGSLSCAAGPPVSCTDSSVLAPGQSAEVIVPVDVAAGAPGTVTNAVSVSGGGAATATVKETSTVSAASPAYGVQSFDGAVSAADGSGDTQAASHPYSASATFQLPTQIDTRTGALLPVAAARDINVDLPPGFIGDPSATPIKCTVDQLTTILASSGGLLPSCPADAQVGVVLVGFHAGDNLDAAQYLVPVFNVEPPAGVPAEFGFLVDGQVVLADASVRTGGDYGLSLHINRISQGLSLISTTLTLWGVPADPSHNALRENFCALTAGFGTCVGSGQSTTATPQPFLTNPSNCAAGPLTTTLSTDSWQNPGEDASASFVSHLPDGTQSGVTGCNLVPFSPTLTAQPATTSADSPTGLAVDLHVPQTNAVNGLASAPLKTVSVALPAGMSVSPSAANGLGACSPDEIGLSNANEPSCPSSAKIGTVEVDTPLLPDPLTGSVYLAQQTNNPFGSLLAIYVTAEADGALIKLAGQIVANPTTGQLTATFDNNPQLPFTDFKLDFFDGPGAALDTPEQCGTYTTQSSLSPWSGTPAATPSDSFTIADGCVSGFSPSFTAGVANPQAGASSPLTLSLSRADTDQELSRLSVRLPDGLLAKLAGVPLCSDADAAAGTCPASSQVGTVLTGAGPGTNPYFLPGRAYLTGAYNGGQYGLVVVVPAIAGPLNLGTVVVRQSIRIDPETAQVSGVSDPFPTILQGIPLRLRRVDVTLNRPGFIVNPTSCDAMQFTGALTSTSGLTAPLASHFQVGGCQALRFSPALKVALTGKGKTRTDDHPRLTATLTQKAGQANLRSAAVTLPLSLALDPKNSQHVCNYDEAKAVHGGAVPCAASTIVGSATAVTPLLSQPLSGKVYLVQGIRFSHGRRIRTLPTLLVALRGQISLDLRAKTSVNGASELVTTFSSIPDAPVSKFTLQITGGHNGLLVITGTGNTGQSQSICNAAQVADAALAAQSAKTHALKTTLSTPCGKPAAVRHTSVKGHTVVVSVRVPGAGQLRLSGTGLKTATAHPRRARTMTFTLALTHSATTKLARMHKLQTHVTMRWTPRNGATHTSTGRALTLRL